MSDPIEIDPSTDDGHIVDPPIVDFLAHDADLKAYVVEFVPEQKVSREQKESVYLHDGSAAARRASELLAELSPMLGAVSPVVKLAHAGDGNFDFYLQNGQAVPLHNSPSSDASFDVYAVLQAIAQEVQLEFVMQRRTRGRAAG